jgi:hypothetical protein
MPGIPTHYFPEGNGGVFDTEFHQNVGQSGVSLSDIQDTVDHFPHSASRWESRNVGPILNGS